MFKLELIAILNDFDMNKKFKKIVAREFLVLLVFLSALLVGYLYVTGYNAILKKYNGLDLKMTLKYVSGIAFIVLYITRLFYGAFLAIRWAIRTLREE